MPRLFIFLICAVLLPASAVAADIDTPGAGKSRFNVSGSTVQQDNFTRGARYPAKTVTHAYANAHTTVRHHLTVTWTARWSLNGGPLQPVPGTVTTTGPLTPLRIAEAVPALSGQRTR